MKKLLILALVFLTAPVRSDDCPELLNFQTTRLHSSESLNFCQAFTGKLLLVVNTASQCGYTPQLKGLESLYQKYKDKGLVVVGFPSNDFHQEYSDEAKTANVCYLNYGVSFPMVSTSSVKSSSANAFFKHLIKQTGQEPQWNFYKYLVSTDGKTVSVYPSDTTPEKLEPVIQAILK